MVSGPSRAGDNGLHLAGRSHSEEAAPGNDGRLPPGNPDIRK